MVDDWLLEHLAKVTALSCVLVVLYFLIYSIWRISQMPNYPWNWNEWQWPLGGRHAVEIIRKRTEMPFTAALAESSKEITNEATLVINYLKDAVPPDVTVLWGPAVSYLMKLINSPWDELMEELMMLDIEPGQWKSVLDSENSEDNNNSNNYFILQRVALSSCHEESEFASSDVYRSDQMVLKPPENFDWNLLKNQFRYPAAVFITNFRMGWSPPQEAFEINGIIQILHVKNEAFPKTSSILAQYLKMNNSQSHLLQSLYVMDDHRADDEGTDDGSSLSPELQEPFSDILCSVCQESPVSRVIIPCRHLCLCTQCFEKVEVCPICRGAIMYYFKTRQDQNPSQSYSNDGLQNPEESPTLWQRIERWNDRFSYASGLIRQF